MKKQVLIYNTFTQQLNENDCGQACLRSVLGYLGFPNDLHYLRQNYNWPDGITSLLDLKISATQVSLESRAVQMDFVQLRVNRNPSILHVENALGLGHFVVCYGTKKKADQYLYLIGDPASYLYYCEEIKLEQIWKSKSALVFESVIDRSVAQAFIPRLPLLTIKGIPKHLWLIIPLLSILSTFLGLITSWAIQKGATHLFLFAKPIMILVIIGLVAGIALFKGAVSYARQRIMINLNADIQDRLVKRMISRLTEQSKETSELPAIELIQTHLRDIGKIQHAYFLISSVVLSEGLLVLMILGYIFYICPSAGLLLCGYLLVLVIYTMKKLPGFIFQHTQVQQLNSVFVTQFLNGLALNIRITKRDDAHQTTVDYDHQTHLTEAMTAAIQNTNVALMYELIGLLVMLLLVCNGVYALHVRQQTHPKFLVVCILGYMVTTLSSRLFSAIFIVWDASSTSKTLMIV